MERIEHRELADRINPDLIIQFDYRFVPDSINKVIYVGDKTYIKPISSTTCDISKCTCDSIEHIGTTDTNKLRENDTLTRALDRGIIELCPIFNTEYFDKHAADEDKLFILNEHLHRYADKKARLPMKYSGCTDITVDFVSVKGDTVHFEVADVFKWVVNSMIDITTNLLHSHNMPYGSHTFRSHNLKQAKIISMCASFAEVFIPTKKLDVENVVEVVEKITDSAKTYRQMYLRGKNVLVIDKILPHTVELHDPYFQKVDALWGISNDVIVKLTHKEVLALKPIPVNAANRVTPLKTVMSPAYIRDNDSDLGIPEERLRDVVRVMDANMDVMYSRNELQPKNVRYAYIMSAALDEMVMYMRHKGSIIKAQRSNKDSDEDYSEKQEQLNLNLWCMILQLGYVYADDPDTIHKLLYGIHQYAY